MTCSYSTLLPGAGTPQRQRSMKRISSVPKYVTQVILCFMPKNTVPVFFPQRVSLGQSVQTVFGPCHSDRQTSQVSHLHHCVLANLKVYHYRPFPSSRLSTTDRLYPGFPARLLRCDLFHSMAGRKNICPIAAGVSLRPGYGS